MSKRFPSEVKRDVVTVVRRGDLTVNEVAADPDISPESVRCWMRQADVDDGVTDGQTKFGGIVPATRAATALSRGSRRGVSRASLLAVLWSVSSLS